MTLAHDVTGDGPDVLLVHSTATDRRMWDPQVPALAGAGFRVIRCDLRGYGETPAPAQPWNDADDVVALLGPEPAAVIASSGGGQIALEVAARWPGRVSALVLLCTALGGHSWGPEMRAFGEREDELLASGDVAGATELNVDFWLTPSAGEATRAAVRKMQRNAFEVQLAAPEEYEPIRVDADPAAITARTLLISGARDVADFHDIAVSLAARIPDSRHLHLDRAGHLPSMERPAEINRLLLSHLGSPARP